MRPNKRHCALAALIVAGLSIGWLAAGAFLSFFPMEKLSTDRFIIESQAPFFTKRAQDGQVFLDPVQKTAPALWAWRGQRTFSLRRNPGTHRILVIGESSAEDIGYRLAEFAQEMRKADRLQIVNLGIGAGSLEWTAEKLKEGLQYRPDAIVLVFGHNLFYTHPLVSSWLADILRHFGKGKIGHLLVRAFVQNTSLNIAPPSRIKAFDSLIGDIASRGSPSSIPVLLATLPSNEMVPPGISSGDLSDERYLEAVFLRRSGRRGAAVLKLGNAVTESPRAWWRFCLGLWYLEDGHSLKARQYLGAALSSDPYEHRATPEINDFIRESSRRHGFLLFDADRWIKDKSPYHIPGWRDMADNQHLRRFNFRLEAWHILNALKHEKWPEIHLPPEPQRTQPFHHGVYFWDIFGFFISQLNQLTREGQSPQKITDGVAVFLTSIDGLLARNRRHDFWDIASRITRTMPACDGRCRAIFLSGLAEALWARGFRARALRECRMAQHLCPSCASPWVQEGLFRLEEGDRKSARDSLIQALKIDPGRKDADFFIKRLEKKAGNRT